MHLQTILPLTLLSALSLSSASAIPARAKDSPALTWHVSDFTTGCSPGGCVYHFNIAGVETPNTPGFDTRCSGTDTQDGYKACDDKHVLATLNPKTYPVWNVQVKHAWTGDLGRDYTTGQANVTAEMEKFDIPVSQEYGVGAQ